MKRAFSLVELMIVVALLGILAAMTLPAFQGHVTEAKEAAAKDNLHILRAAIELYAARNNDVPPGYPANNPAAPPYEHEFKLALVKGNYLAKMPENPFNNEDTMLMITNDADLPSSATGQYGWIYKAATKTIRLDWPGTDKNGQLYYDY